MAISGPVFVTSRGGVGTGTITTNAVDSSGSDFLVIGLSYQPTSGATISDSKVGNTWNSLTRYISSNNEASRLYWCVPVSVGSGHTFTATGTAFFPGISAMGYSGVDQSSPFDVENGNAPASAVASFQTGSVTPSNAGSLIVSTLNMYNTVASVTIDLSFTIETSVSGSGGVSYGNAMADLIQGAASALNPTWADSSFDLAATAIAVFNPVGGGGGANQPMMRRWGAFQPVQGVGQSSGGGKGWG